MSKVEVNQISSQCGSTLTIGQSGDTVTLAAGATQSGFGRTGTVDWDTTAKTASFTAVSGTGYFVNTTSGPITVTLPASPSANDIVSIADYAGTAATNNITVARNGSNFEGSTENGAISVNRQTGTFIYVDGTQGWVVVNSNDASFIAPTFITATGGTVTCCGDYKIHTFTSPGTFTVCSVGNPLGSTTVDYLVVAGGAGGGGNDGGGGGAGGFRESKAPTGPWTASPLATCASLPVTVQGYPITVGGGGSAGNNVTDGGQGSNSVFSTITSTGGGGGAAEDSPGVPADNRNGDPGGSGGGAAGSGGTSGPAGGTGNTPPVSPPQGNPGGAGPGAAFPIAPTCRAGGGGGGAGVAGSNGVTSTGGNGGNGVTTSISASPTTYTGGGGAGGRGSAGSGGTGGGGAGANTTTTATAGTTNTGGGGGGAGEGTPNCRAAAGGSGIVIIRYKYQ